MYGSSAAKGAGAFGNDISGIQKAIERCLDTARERLASDMARKFSEKELSDTLWEK